MFPTLRKAVLATTTMVALAFGGCRSNESGSAKKPDAIVLNEENAEKATGQDLDPVDRANITAYDSFITVEAAPGAVRLFWKDPAGQILGSLGATKQFAENLGDTLRFVMNAGMYTEDQGPLGLFIQEGKTLRSLNRDTGYGNFYLRPNGVFFITKGGKAGVCRTQDFPAKKSVRWATQSGPMLLVGGRMHPAFRQGSVNVNIRNGVGILPDGRVLLAISTLPVNFWDFAAAFQRRGCKDALYLDGAVSRAWFPEGNITDTGGAFGVTLGVVKER